MKIPIVDIHDNVICYKERDDRNPNDIIRITAIWITDENDNILLQQRKLTKKHNPGKWGPAVAGTVEEGETYDDNAYKEMQEEIGVTGVDLTKSEKIYGVTNTGKRFVQLYTAKISRERELVIEKDEVEQIKWFTKDELKKEFEENKDSFVGAMEDLIKKFI